MTRSRDDISIELSLTEEALFLDDFDDCVLGMADGFSMYGVVAYDLKKVIAKLMLGGLSEPEAFEYWSFNMIGAWVGDMTPVYITLLEEESIGSTDAKGLGREQLREDAGVGGVLPRSGQEDRSDLAEVRGREGERGQGPPSLPGDHGDAPDRD